MSTQLEIARVLAPLLRIPAHELTGSTGLGRVPTWDSLGHLQVVVTIENAFGLQMTDEEVGTNTTIEQLAEWVEAHR